MIELKKKMDGLDLSFPTGVAKSDSGNYTCEATNNFGVATYTIAVYVLGVLLNAYVIIICYYM